jgi:hypothetical protein
MPKLEGGDSRQAKSGPPAFLLVLVAITGLAGQKFVLWRRSCRNDIYLEDEVDEGPATEGRTTAIFLEPLARVSETLTAAPTPKTCKFVLGIAGLAWLRHTVEEVSPGLGNGPSIGTRWPPGLMIKSWDSCAPIFPCTKTSII